MFRSYESIPSRENPGQILTVIPLEVPLKHEARKRRPWRVEKGRTVPRLEGAALMSGVSIGRQAG